MSTSETVYLILGLSFVISIVAAKKLTSKGYSFGHYFIASFIAACGVLGIIFKIVNDYLIR
jgi:hypothetical protein